MSNPTDWRALCAELIEIVEEHCNPDEYALLDVVNVLDRARTALSQPEPEGVTDEELVELDDSSREAVHAAVAEALGDVYDCLRVWDAWSYGTMGPDDFSLVAEDDDRVAEIADAAINALARPTIQPVPVAERLPGPSDCIRRGDDDWCWGQERSLLTGQAAARWRLMRVSSLADEAMAWAPHWALPVPQQEPQP